MKSTLLLLAAFGLMVSTAQAQDDTKLKNDPTYSTHNYKHPNKAAKARQWEANSGTEVRPPYQAANRQANYKNQSPNPLPAGGVTVPHTPNEQLANRNYKAQQPQGTPNTDVARKPEKAKTGLTTTGE
jgi:hypothetical protein